MQVLRFYYYYFYVYVVVKKLNSMSTETFFLLFVIGLQDTLRVNNLTNTRITLFSRR